MDGALDGAARRFWRHGYAAKSMIDLEAATGLRRQSICKRFGNKSSASIKLAVRIASLGNVAFGRTN